MGDNLHLLAQEFLDDSIRWPEIVGAAAITTTTSATAVVVSATDGLVRVFSHGELVLQMDPALPILRHNNDDGGQFNG